MFFVLEMACLLNSHRTIEARKPKLVKTDAAKPLPVFEPPFPAERRQKPNVLENDGAGSF
jgi:hypothetical protein